ncbi:MAG TPA: Holliday junction branch migration protein RuvA [Anaerolineae bacterium]|nr:Holliday junction branch migration protein RuvA [Anaerolineae bacterium]
MIASLTGYIVSTGKESLVIAVGGVGFRVSVPQALLDNAAEQVGEMTLFTHLHVRENELALYGFASEDELVLFRLLLTVSGIGPKVAMTILSTLPPDRLRAAIVQEDVPILTRVPGIGPKTAKKLAFELKDKLADELGGGGILASLSEADADLIAALTGLGYSVAEAQEAIRSLPHGPLPFEERVRLALAYFGS